MNDFDASSVASLERLGGTADEGILQNVTDEFSKSALHLFSDLLLVNHDCTIIVGNGFQLLYERTVRQQPDVLNQ
jgi:hypothetical protein